MRVLYLTIITFYIFCQSSTGQKVVGVNVKLFGAIGDGISDDTKSIQNAINESNGKVFFPNGVYSISTIVVKNGITIVGESKAESIISFNKKISLEALITGVDIKNLTISNIQISNLSIIPIVLIEFKGLTGLKNITITDCLINSKYALSDCIALGHLMSDIKIENCTINCISNPPITRNFKQVACIKIYNKDENNNRKSPINITNNYLTGGNCGLRLLGKGNPPGPIYFEKNEISGQIGSGAVFYHSTFCFVKNNSFNNIIATSFNNNDGAVVWLDQYREGRTEFINNTISNCNGNGVYMEELQSGLLEGNKITNLHKRVGDTFSTFFRNHLYTSFGGHGILITGGTTGVKIQNNLISKNEGSGILIDRNFGVQQNYSIDSIYILNNIIENNSEVGIKVGGKAGIIFIKSNNFYNNNINYNSKNQLIPNVSAVNIDRINVDDKIKGLVFNDNIITSSNIENKAIVKSYTGGNLECINNQFVKYKNNDAVLWKDGITNYRNNTYPLKNVRIK